MFIESEATVVTIHLSYRRIGHYNFFLSVGAGWAGMVWDDVCNELAPAPTADGSKLKSESAPESGSYV